jgi:signal transduction histidine kinase
MRKQETTYTPQKHPLLLVRLHQEKELQKQYVAQLPRWRHPIIGYIVCFPLIALGLLFPFVEQILTGQNLFLGIPFFLMTILVALFWGTGPALCSIVLSWLTLDYFFLHLFLPPSGQIQAISWPALAPLAPYIVAEVFVALITAQREHARRRALFAEQEMQAHAQELEQINEQLKQAHQLKDIFFSRASHELKTPLTTIQGQAQIGLRRLAKISPQPAGLDLVENSLNKIDEQTHRLHGLIDDLLDLGMLSAGKMRLRLKSCNLSEICREIVEDQRLLSGRTIELDLPERKATLRADQERLNQVILNLLTNAIKYSPADSTIQLRILLPSTSSTIQLQIHNLGPAIPLEQQESIFEPFHRVQNIHTPTKQGWGLGLAISKDIIERHNGQIWVVSSETAGTTFYVELPRS